MPVGLDRDDLDMVLDAIGQYARSHLPDAKLRELDAADEFPEAIVREMCGEGLGVSLLFISEEFGGMGGSAMDIYRVCEQLAAIDVGIATGVLATFLGSDPIMFGGTPEQQKRWMTRIANEGLLMAYGATEPEAGQRSGRDEDHCGADRRERPGRGLRAEREQAVDLQRRLRRCVHRARPGARWSDVVRRRAGHARIHPRQA